MPSTVNGLLIFILALVPGVPGEAIYSHTIGTHYQESQVRRITRIIVISVSGLIAYVLLGGFGKWSGWFVLPEPIYVIPGTFAEGVSVEQTYRITEVYIWHVILATLVGVAITYSWKYAFSLVESAPYPSAWDKLVTAEMNNRWVVVESVEGNSFLGQIDRANAKAKEGRRDLILEKPRRYDEETGGYVRSEYSKVYFREDEYHRIAVVAQSEPDVESDNS